MKMAKEVEPVHTYTLSNDIHAVERHRLYRAEGAGVLRIGAMTGRIRRASEIMVERLIEPWPSIELVVNLKRR